MSELYESYKDALDDIQASCESAVAETVNGDFSKKHLSLGYEGAYPPGPEEDIPHTGRGEMESDFIKLFGEGDLGGVDHRSIAMQADVLGALEKTYRMLHTTGAQMFARGASQPHGTIGPSGFLRHLASLPLRDD